MCGARDAPQEEEISSTATPTSIALSWTKTGNATDEYAVFYHKGKMGTGAMKPGFLMGTACAVRSLQKLHGGSMSMAAVLAASAVPAALRVAPSTLAMAMAHGVTQAENAWWQDRSAYTITGLEPGGEYHVRGAVASERTATGSHLSSRAPASQIDVLVRRLVGGDYEERAYHSDVVFTPQISGAGAASAAGLAIGTALLSVWAGRVAA